VSRRYPLALEEREGQARPHPWTRCPRQSRRPPDQGGLRVRPVSRVPGL